MVARAQALKNECRCGRGHGRCREQRELLVFQRLCWANKRLGSVSELERSSTPCSRRTSRRAARGRGTLPRTPALPGRRRPAVPGAGGVEEEGRAALLEPLTQRGRVPPAPAQLPEPARGATPEAREGRWAPLPRRLPHVKLVVWRCLN